MMALRTYLALAVGIGALHTPPPRRTPLTRINAASISAAVEEAKFVPRRDLEAQAIDRAVARVTRDMDRVDFSSDRRGALEGREKVALGAATALAAGAAGIAAAPAAMVAAGAALTAAVGGYEEWAGLRAAANAHEVSAVAVRAAAEAEEILASAERVKSVLPVCVVLGATATALSSSAPALLEMVKPAATAWPSQNTDVYYDKSSSNPFLKYKTPTLETPVQPPVFVDRSAAVRTRTLVSLVCPAVAILAASVAVVAEQDSRRRCAKAQALGRRRFATRGDVGRTWRSVVELSQDEAKADTALWVGFARSILPAPVAASILSYTGSFALAAPVACGVAAAQAAFYLAAAEYGVARATESVASKGRTAAVADAYSKQAMKACAWVPRASAAAALACAVCALVVEVAPKALGPRLPKAFGLGFALVGAALVRDAAKFRARTRGDAAAAAAAADQLAGLDDGADDDPLLPLALTWRNFKATLTASLDALVAGFRRRPRLSDEGMTFLTMSEN